MSLWGTVIFSLSIVALLTLYRTQTVTRWMHLVVPTTALLGALIGLVTAVVFGEKDASLAAHLLIGGLLTGIGVYIVGFQRVCQAIAAFHFCHPVSEYLLHWFDTHQAGSQISLSMLRDLAQQPNANVTVINYIIDHIAEIGHEKNLLPVDVPIQGQYTFGFGGMNAYAGGYASVTYQIERADVEGDENKAGYIMRADIKHSGWLTKH